MFRSLSLFLGLSISGLAFASGGEPCPEPEPEIEVEQSHIFPEMAQLAELQQAEVAALGQCVAAYESFMSSTVTDTSVLQLQLIALEQGTAEMQTRDRLDSVNANLQAVTVEIEGLGSNPDAETLAPLKARQQRLQDRKAELEAQLAAQTASFDSGFAQSRQLQSRQGQAQRQAVTQAQQAGIQLLEARQASAAFASAKGLSYEPATLDFTPSVELPGGFHGCFPEHSVVAAANPAQ